MRPERTGGKVACKAVVSFPIARGDRASERGNERAWGEQNHFAPLIPFVKARWEGKGIYYFCPKLPPPISYSCYLSVPATQAR